MKPEGTRYERREASRPGEQARREGQETVARNIADALNRRDQVGLQTMTPIQRRVELMRRKVFGFRNRKLAKWRKQ